MKASMLALFLALGVPLFFYQPAHAGSTSKKVSSQAMKQQAAKNKINLNKADLNTLTHAYKGIGKSRAQAVIAYREKYHDFQSIDELAKVKGFGKAYVKRNKAALERTFTLSDKP